jgi:uncharacterized membrane protein YgdD (TMEM256/DUF423 family)
MLLAIAGLYGASGVALGAFGAHALKGKLPEDRLAHLEMAVRYLFFTIPGLVAAAWLASQCISTSTPTTVAGYAFALGVLLFSGSLVALALTGNRRWGAVTPLGGLALMIGWVALAVAGSNVVAVGDFYGVLVSC